jgi:hypothetical protein
MCRTPSLTLKDDGTGYDKIRSECLKKATKVARFLHSAYAPVRHCVPSVRRNDKGEGRHGHERVILRKPQATEESYKKNKLKN